MKGAAITCKVHAFKYLGCRLKESRDYTQEVKAQSSRIGGNSAFSVWLALSGDTCFPFFFMGLRGERWLRRWRGRWKCLRYGSIAACLRFRGSLTLPTCWIVWVREWRCSTKSSGESSGVQLIMQGKIERPREQGHGKISLLRNISD